MASPPTPTTGALTVNSTTGVILSPITAALFKSANGLGDAADIVITDDVATNATMYPVWVTANAGALPLYVASTKLSFNPSTGRLTSTAGTIGSIGLAASSLTGVATLTSPALADLLVGTGTAGTALTIASATRIATFAAGVNGTSITLSSLTSGRVPFASTAGLLSDASSLTFNSGTGLLTATGFAASALTSTALLLGGGSAAINPADLTYVSPTLTVQDAFVVSSAGSIGLTAGGSNKNVTLTPSDSGAQGAVTTRAAYSGQTIIGTGGLQVVKQAVSGAVFPSVEILGYGNGFTAQPFIVVARANGTEAAPTTTGISATVGGFRFYGRANSLWKNLGNVSTETSATFSDSDFSSVMRIGPSNISAQTNQISLFGKTGNTNIGATNSADLGSLLAIGVPAGAYTRAASWGVNGTNFSTQTATFTDAVASGTVATAVANSFATPTFTSTSVATFTDAFNAYMAGPVARTGNLTITRSHTLGIVDATSASSSITGGFIVAATLGTAATSTGIGGGNINTGGTLTTGGTITANTAVIDGSAATTFTGGAGNMTITAGTGASRTLTLRTTTSGSTATNWLVGDASQNTTAGGSITTSTPNGGTAGAWKMGIRVAATVILDTTQYIQLDVGGTLYKIAIAS